MNMDFIKEEADTDYSDCYHDKYSTYTSNQTATVIQNYSDNINSLYGEQLMMKSETLDYTNSTLTMEENTHNADQYKAQSSFSSNLHYAPEKGKRNIYTFKNMKQTMPNKTMPDFQLNTNFDDKIKLVLVPILGMRLACLCTGLDSHLSFLVKI